MSDERIRTEFDYRDNHWRLVETDTEVRLEIRLGGEWSPWSVAPLRPVIDFLEDSDDAAPDEIL